MTSRERLLVGRLHEDRPAVASTGIVNVGEVLPDPTDRLRFRETAPSDLDDMAELLGDPAVMAYYPAPKSRDEARGWIEWNLRNY